MENPTLTPNANLRAGVMELLRAFAGSENVIAIPRTFIAWTGDLTAALVLNQILFWQTGDDGWVAVPYKRWYDQYALTEYKVRSAVKLLKEMNIGFETRFIKTGQAPQLHYHIERAPFEASLLAFLRANARTTNADLEENQTSSLSADAVQTASVPSALSVDHEKNQGSTLEKLQGPDSLENQEQENPSVPLASPVARRREEPDAGSEADGSLPSVEPPSARRKLKPRPNDALFAVVAREAFGLRPWQRAGPGVAARIGQVVREIAAAYPGISPDVIVDAFAWFDRERRLSRPRDPAKIVALLGDYQRARRDQRARDKAEDPTRTLPATTDDEIEWPDIIVDHRGRYVGDDQTE